MLIVLNSKGDSALGFLAFLPEEVKFWKVQIRECNQRGVHSGTQQPDVFQVVNLKALVSNICVLTKSCHKGAEQQKSISLY